MIEINLLPEEIKNSKKKYFKLDLENLEFSKLNIKDIKVFAGGLFVGSLIFFVLFFSLSSCVRKKQTSGWLLREKAIATQKREAESIEKEISNLTTKLFTLAGIINRQYLWSQKLGELSDLILPGMWFTSFATDSNKRFIIEGSVISKQEEAMATVGKFMKAIQDKQSFYKDFSKIQLESVEKQEKEKSGTVDFKIVLYFK